MTQQKQKQKQRQQQQNKNKNKNKNQKTKTKTKTKIWGNLVREMSGEPWEGDVGGTLGSSPRCDLVRDVGGTFGDVGDISRGCRGNLGHSWKFFLRIS